MFRDMDADGDGTLSKEEFREAYENNPKVYNKFAVLEFERHEILPPDSEDESPYNSPNNSPRSGNRSSFVMTTGESNEKPSNACVNQEDLWSLLDVFYLHS